MVPEHRLADARLMKFFVLVILMLSCVGCTSADTKAPDDSDSESVLLITRPDGQDGSAWDLERGHLRVQAGCILFKGQLAAFPFGTRLIDGSTALQISDDEDPISLNGSAEVDVMGSEVPLAEQGDWDHAMDAGNLDRWSECRRRANISEYADWWQVGQLELVSTG
jgi:hypothetical protein